MRTHITAHTTAYTRKAKIKNSILAMGMLLFLGGSLFFSGKINTANARFQDRIYCTIKGETLTVSLKKNNNYLCKNYILYLQNRIYKEYQTIQKINKLIQQRDNTLFWVNIKEKKFQNIKKINALIQKIQYNTNTFEKNLLTIIQKYLKKTLDQEYFYYNKIENNFIYINTSSKEIINLQNKITQIKNTIIQTQASTTMDELLNKLTQYLYLKKEIK